jgi:hypothetical protein
MLGNNVDQGVCLLCLQLDESELQDLARKARPESHILNEVRCNRHGTPLEYAGLHLPHTSHHGTTPHRTALLGGKAITAPACLQTSYDRRRVTAVYRDDGKRGHHMQVGTWGCRLIRKLA